MSSHREAPQISKDPTADSSDLYAFVSPDDPSTVTLIANYVPLQAPDGGPNFYEFGDDVLYSINIDNDGDGEANIAYHFRFTTVNNIPGSFLYNNGPITELTKPGTAGSNWNRQQTYHLTRVDFHKNGKKTSTVLGKSILVPPCNIGPRSTPDYENTFLPSSGKSAVHSFDKDGYSGKVFAGQRADAFFVDLGSVFDLGTLRPFQNLHLIPSAAAAGINSLGGSNVHSLALQVPIEELTHKGHKPSDPESPHAVIGVWTTASRQKIRMTAASKKGEDTGTGPWTQVSRLGNPLVNEALIGIEDKDKWNAEPPTKDGTRFFGYFANPLLAKLLNVLYPGVFPNLASYIKKNHGTTPSKPGRPDLVAILLSGIPAGIVPGFRTNGGDALADMLRLNVAIPPSSDPDSLGVLGGDLAGFPNGRRVGDNVVAIELRAIAGATLPLVDPSYTPDGAASLLTDGTSGPDALSAFPYLATPYSSYATPDTTPVGHTG
ncbi:MAG: DUF4331 domain-containing protein [Frankiaceae bacterium]|nr:DUF4331 domain-containing protein [Frankiaceae bacterium]